MTSQLWIALGFVAALVLFLMITYFRRDTSTRNQHKTLRFLTSLCAGFAGGFFTGDALFHYEQQLSSGAKLGISGTAGFALFFVVWFTFGDWEVPPPPNRFRLSIPDGLTFEQAARVIVESAHGNPDFQGFKDGQLSVKMRASEIDAIDAQGALTKLRYLAHDGFPDYRVDVDDGVFHIRNLEASHDSKQ
jgi:hypothetical protein